jgi:hypothetical protein
MKVLAVEEMQSDLAQGVARGDVKGNYGNEIADFPFKNNWYELTIKRLLRYAADNDFDAVAIPKGSISAKRYGQSFGEYKRINFYRGERDSIVVDYLDDAGQSVEAYRYTDTGFDLTKKFSELKKEVGEKIYSQIINSTESGINKINLDKPIIIGSGKGKYELYDKAIPSFMKKYGKKWNAKVYDNELDLGLAYGSEETGKMPVTIIQLTDDMKKSVQTDGQALFSLFGLGVGAEMVSDNIQNNIISQTTN